MAEEKKAAEKPPPEFKFDNKMISKPIIAPDGHVVLSQEDIDNRDKTPEEIANARDS